ncbi:MAG: hypothetical protein C4525_15125 [Desulfarculus sp.]|jgi:hypothetical protein|nr:MAG: hypothetical protein C4525_15125 [Desulfarculus sp.]
MECPHCKQELPALPCATCGQKALPGASFCHHCGHELPAPEGEPPKLLTCASCGQTSPQKAKFCAECGEQLEDLPVMEGLEPGKRTACSDGNCIGIISPEGKCIECGKPYTGPAV